MRAALALRERLALVQPRAVQELRAHAAHHAASSCSCASCHSDASARLLVTRRRAGSTFPSRSRGAEVLAQDSIDGVEGIDQSIRHAEQGRIELSFVAESRVGRTQRGNGRRRLQRSQRHGHTTHRGAERRRETVAPLSDSSVGRGEITSRRDERMMRELRVRESSHRGDHDARATPGVSAAGTVRWRAGGRTPRRRCARDAPRLGAHAAGPDPLPSSVRAVGTAPACTRGAPRRPHAAGSDAAPASKRTWRARGGCSTAIRAPGIHRRHRPEFPQAREPTHAGRDATMQGAIDRSAGSIRLAARGDLPQECPHPTNVG